MRCIGKVPVIAYDDADLQGDHSSEWRSAFEMVVVEAVPSRLKADTVIENQAAVKGHVMLCYTGGVPHVDLAKQAADMGATGVIIIGGVEMRTYLLNIGGVSEIPVLSIGLSAAALLRVHGCAKFRRRSVAIASTSEPRIRARVFGGTAKWK